MLVYAVFLLHGLAPPDAAGQGPGLPRRALDGGRAILAVTRVAVPMSALLAIAGWMRMTGRMAAPGRRPTIVAAALLLVGLVAFLSTRGHAHDAASPPPMDRQPFAGAQPVRLPRVDCCLDAEPALVIRIDAGRAALLGILETEDPAGLGAGVAARRAALEKLRPGDLATLPAVSASPEAPMARLVPWLSTIGQADGALTMLVDRPETVVTRTLGSLQRLHRCVLRLSLDQAVASPAPTWAPLALTLP